MHCGWSPRLFLGLRCISFGLPLADKFCGKHRRHHDCQWFMSTNAWVKFCNDIDKEIPIFLSGFTSTIQVNPNVLQAVEEEASVLAAEQPFEKWLIDRFVRQGQERGISALDELIAEAFRVSNSLGVMVFLIGRLWRTGGMEWRRSFALASANLEGVMEARVMGIAAGTAAQQRGQSHHRRDDGGDPW